MKKSSGENFLAILVYERKFLKKKLLLFLEVFSEKNGWFVIFSAHIFGFWRFLLGLDKNPINSIALIVEQVAFKIQYI